MPQQPQQDIREWLAQQRQQRGGRILSDGNGTGTGLPAESPVPAGSGQPGTEPASSPGLVHEAANFLGNVGVGALKGAGDTAFNLGKIVHNTPVVGSITDALARMIGPEGTDPDAAFKQLPPDLEAQGMGQSTGKFLEQAGEYLIPANAARKGVIQGLVKYGIPNSASPGAMRILNKAAALAGRTIGDVASAYGVAAAHGQENPEREAMMGAAVPAATYIGSQAMRALPIVAPYLVGGQIGHALGGNMGMVGGLTLANQARRLTNKALAPYSPMMFKMGQDYLPGLLRLLIGAEEESRPDQPQPPPQTPPTGPGRLAFQGR